VNTTNILAVRTILVTGLLCLAPAAAQAEFFKYKDSSGSLVITNKLEDIPKKYRNSVKVVWDSELEAKDPLARRKAAAKAQMEQQERQQAAQQAQASAQEKKRSGKEKTLVITLDENTGEIVRSFE
jgi:hypothetical protein